MAAAIGLLLGLIHLSIWLRDRKAYAFLLAAIMSLGAGATALLELRTAHSATAEAYLRYAGLSHYAIACILVPMVWFVRVQFGAGRRWMALLISSVWIIGALAEFLTPGHAFFTSVVLKHHVTRWGDEYVIGEAVVTSIKPILDLTIPLMLVFVADASVTAYRRGRRNEALRFGTAIIFFILVAGIHAVLVDVGVVQTPYMVSLAFTAIALALGLGLTADVARAAAATRGLEQQRNRWRALLNGIQLAVVSIDRDGRIAYINPFMERLIMRASGDLVGKKLDEIAPTTSERTHATTRDRWRAGHVPAIPSQVLTASGETRLLNWFNVELRDSVGEPDGFVSFGEDVTDRQRTREELTRTRLEIEKLTRVVMLGELASSLAHELSQPIAAILSNVQSAHMIRSRDMQPTGEMDEILDAILRDTRRAGGIMDRVRKMLFNKPPELERFDLADALGEVLDIFAHDAAAKSIAIVLVPPAQPVVVRASRLELQQVVMNLVLNGVQAITTADSPCKHIDIAWWRDGQSVTLVVDDTGPGISESLARDIFNPFVSSKETGMGIGLAVSRRIVERHLGRIDIGASQAGGASFRLTLPISQQPEEGRGAVTT
jgi:PAS domain S-box-containing protein